MYVDHSVHCLTSLLKLGYQWYLMFWVSYLSQIFQRYTLDVCTLVSNSFRFLVCLSVCSLPHFLTEIRLSVISPVLDELSFWNFLEIYLGCLTLVANNFRFLLCLSVCSLPRFLTDIMLTVDISSSGWASFLKFSGDIPGISVH